MLGFIRARAASTLVALLAGPALAVSLPAETVQAKTPSSKKGKKPPPAPEEDSSDIEITVIDPGTDAKKPAPKQDKKSKKGKKSKKDEVAPEEVELEEEPEQTPEPPPEPKAPYHKNWITFTIQQELLAFSSETNICPSTASGGLDIPGSESYSCRDAAGVYAGPVVNGLGNSVQGGLGFATTRIMAGYERVLIDRLTLGGRLGWAFGTAPSAEGATSAIPVHVEVRSAFYFGSAPFENRSVRPFASLGAGMGEVDGVVKVEIYPQPEGPVTEVDAWRRTGTAFIAFGGGAAYPLGDFTINAELRGILLLGSPGFALGIALGGAYGF